MVVTGFDSMMVGLNMASLKSSCSAVLLSGEPKQTYNISVYPVLGTMCGAASTLQATLESGGEWALGSHTVQGLLATLTH